MMLPKCGTLLTYGNALVMSTLRSPSTGRIFFFVSVMEFLCCGAVLASAGDGALIEDASRLSRLLCVVDKL
jgi:hypothetical protein